MLIGIAASVTLALSGCAGEPAEPENRAYAERIAEARSYATSQFEKDVLSDGQVTRAEYEEAVQRYVNCIEEHGGEVTLQDQTGYYVYAIGGDMSVYDNAADDCAEGTKGLIEGLYVDMFTNPDNIDPDELTAECFASLGIVPAPFTRADFQELLKSAGAIAQDDSAEDSPINPEAQRILSTQEASNCLANPSYHTIFDDDAVG